LVSAKNDDSMNSTFGHRAEVDRQTSLLCIHPLDADSRGIVEGMQVEVFNGRGSCFFQAIFDDRLPRRVLRARSIRWNKHAPARYGVNCLTSDRLTDLGGGPTFYNCLVDVKPHLDSTFGTAE
jgi:anaerobic selenocysteine-containing dehydrogenase